MSLLRGFGGAGSAGETAALLAAVQPQGAEGPTTLRQAWAMARPAGAPAAARPAVRPPRVLDALPEGGVDIDVDLLPPSRRALLHVGWGAGREPVAIAVPNDPLPDAAAALNRSIFDPAVRRRPRPSSIARATDAGPDRREVLVGGTATAGSSQPPPAGHPPQRKQSNPPGARVVRDGAERDRCRRQRRSAPGPRGGGRRRQPPPLSPPPYQRRLTGGRAGRP